MEFHVFELMADDLPARRPAPEVRSSRSRRMTLACSRRPGAAADTGVSPMGLISSP